MFARRVVVAVQAVAPAPAVSSTSRGMQTVQPQEQAIAPRTSCLLGKHEVAEYYSLVNFIVFFYLLGCQKNSWNYVNWESYLISHFDFCAFMFFEWTTYYLNNFHNISPKFFWSFVYSVLQYNSPIHSIWLYPEWWASLILDFFPSIAAELLCMVKVAPVLGTRKRVDRWGLF